MRPTAHLTEAEVVAGLADGTLVSELVIVPDEGLKQVAVYAEDVEEVPTKDVEDAQ